MTSSWCVTKLPDWRGPVPGAAGVEGGAGDDASLTSLKESSNKTQKCCCNGILYENEVFHTLQNTGWVHTRSWCEWLDVFFYF